MIRMGENIRSVVMMMANRVGDDNLIRSISLSLQKKCSCITPCGTHTVGLLGWYSASCDAPDFGLD